MTPIFSCSISVISWKWVANRQYDYISLAICSAIAQAIPNPSEVDVPLPNSSIMINESALAVFNMQLASNISLMNVLTPLVWMSLAPTLVMIASTIGILAYEHGTYDPICANNTHMATYRIYVDLPPILGPVMICNRLDYLSISKSFIIQLASIASNRGCLESFRIISFL